MTASPLRFADPGVIRRDVARVIRPPLRQTVDQTAAQSMRVRGRGGASEPWSADLTPYMVQPMQRLTSRRYESVVFVGPARTGKTLAADALIAHVIVADPADTCIVHMTQDTARDYSLTRIRRMLRQSPELAAGMSRHAQEDNTYDKFTRAGTIIKIAWPSIRQLSGKEFRFVAATDYDRIDDDIDGEGDLYGLLQKRTATYLSAGKGYYESSPGRECRVANWRRRSPHEAPPVGGVIGLYNRSTRHRWYWSCRECAAWFMVPPDLSLFPLPPHEELVEIVLRVDLSQMAREAAIIGCPQCGAAYDQGQRRVLNLSGRWLADGQRLTADGELTGNPPETAIDGYYLGAAAAAYQPWKSLVYNYLVALKDQIQTGDDAPLKRTITQDQGGVYFPPVASMRGRVPHELEARAEHWTKGQVPEGVRLLLAAVDIQHNRFVVQIMGYGPHRERWLIDRYNLARSDRQTEQGKPAGVDPGAYPEDWRLLIPLIEKSYPLADGSGRRIRLRAVASDSGGEGGVTANAYAFWRWCRTEKLARPGRGGRFYLMKGGSAKDAPRAAEKWPDSSSRKDRRTGGRGDVPVWMLNVNSIKDTLASDLARTEPGPGYLHTPSWLGTWWYEELTREQPGPKGWEAKTKNEAWDLCVYADALYHILGLDVAKWDTSPPPWADAWERNALVFAEGNPPPAESLSISTLGKRLNG